MGSICSNQNTKKLTPPADLSELLQQSEKAGGAEFPWLVEFQKYCTDLDTKTKVVWRLRLLEFVMEVRTIQRLSKDAGSSEEKEDTVKNLILQLEEKYFPAEGGIPISDSSLRYKFVQDLEQFRESVKGLQESSREVLEGKRITVPSITSLIQQIYLDPSVWDKLEKLYLQFLSKNPTLPSMAVILSIL